MPLINLTPTQLETMLTETPQLQVIDVRTPEEWVGLGHIPQATLIPLHELPHRYKTLDTTKPTVLVCQHGVRSLEACYFLADRGHETLYNLAEGMSTWLGPVAFGAD